MQQYSLKPFPNHMLWFKPSWKLNPMKLLLSPPTPPMRGRQKADVLSWDKIVRSIIWITKVYKRGWFTQKSAHPLPDWPTIQPGSTCGWPLRQRQSPRSSCSCFSSTTCHILFFLQVKSLTSDSQRRCEWYRITTQICPHSSKLCPSRPL